MQRRSNVLLNICYSGRVSLSTIAGVVSRSVVVDNDRREIDTEIVLRFAPPSLEVTRVVLLHGTAW